MQITFTFVSETICAYVSISGKHRSYYIFYSWGKVVIRSFSFWSKRNKRSQLEEEWDDFYVMHLHVYYGMVLPLLKLSFYSTLALGHCHTVFMF